MSEARALVDQLIAAGVSPGEAAEIIIRAALLGAAPKDAAAEKRREWDRQRKRAKRPPDSTGIPPDRVETAASPQKTFQPLPEPSSQDQNPLTSRPPSPPTGAHGSAPSDFAEFWSAYPNKVGKRDAEASYGRAVKRADAAAILAGLERAKHSRKWGEGFIPNPATWLNQDRWLDEPDERSRAPPMTGGMVAAASDEMAFRNLMARYQDEDGNRERDQGVVVALSAPAARAG